MQPFLDAYADVKGRVGIILINIMLPFIMAIDKKNPQVYNNLHFCIITKKERGLDDTDD